MELDWVDIWKILSVTLTGAFGVLGLLTEYKDYQTKRVTRWGYVSLGGILLSTVGGISAEIVDTHRVARDARQASEQSGRIARYAARAVANGHVELDEIRKLLSPIGGSRIVVTLVMDCSVKDARITRLCSIIRSESFDPSHDLSDAQHM